MRVGERTVIPVARVRAAGGFGRGGPGGGSLDAAPMGFIDVTAAGARFEPVAGAPRSGRVPGAGLVVAAAAGLAASALLRRGRRRPLLPR